MSDHARLGMPAPEVHQDRFLWVILLIFIIIIGLFFRVNNLSAKSLWSDEFATIASVNGQSIDPTAFERTGKSLDPQMPEPAVDYRGKATLPMIPTLDCGPTIRVLRNNIHPPLFFCMMQPVLRTVGSNPVSLRILPIVFATLCLPMIFLLGRGLRVYALDDEDTLQARQRRGNALGLVTAAIFALSAYQVAHAQDARPYTLTLLIAITSAWWLLRTIHFVATHPSGDPARSPWYPWVVMSLLSAVGLYSQYFYGFYLVFLYAFALWMVRPFGPKLRLRVLVSAGLTTLLFLPWLPILLHQLSFFREGGHYTMGLWNPLHVPEKLWRVFAAFIMPESAIGSIFMLVVCLSVSVVYLRKLFSREAYGRRISYAVQMALAWMATLIVMQIVLDLVQNTHTLSIKRYLILASPAFALLVAHSLLVLQRLLRQTFPALTRLPKYWLVMTFCVWMGVHTWQLQSGDALISEDFLNAAGYINDHVQIREAVLVHKSGAPAIGIAYYLNDAIPVRGLHEDHKKGLPLSDLGAISADYDGLWVVYSHAAESNTVRINNALMHLGYTVAETQPFKGITLIRYRRP
ncbi:MAG: hypothetical protein AB7P76_07170 [Candidatus Melainabacteria bacterium]